MLEVGADEANAAEKRRMRKENKDQGFSSYEDAAIRKYDNLVKGIKPDMEKYEADKARLGDAFYANTGTVVHGLHKDSKEGIGRMVEDLEKQISKREKYSRRRMYNDDKDVDFINERNMKFNQKLERFYGQYTTEIKQNLERGTAV